VGNKTEILQRAVRNDVNSVTA